MKLLIPEPYPFCDGCKLRFNLQKQQIQNGLNNLFCYKGVALCSK
jgi:hypothetical protein